MKRARHLWSSSRFTICKGAVLVAPSPPVPVVPAYSPATSASTCGVSTSGAQDVKVMSFPDDPGLSPCPATERSSVVGQRSYVDLHPSELLPCRKDLACGCRKQNGHPC